MEISIEGDVKKFERQLKDWERVAIPKATARTLNTTARTVRASTVQVIAANTNLKQKKVRESVVIGVRARPKAGKLFTTIEAKPNGMNLIEFVSPGKREVGAFHKKEGVKAKAWGKNKIYRGTFIGRGRGSGKLLVFTRTSKDRYPIKAVRGPSIPRAFVDKVVATMQRHLAVDTFRKRFPGDLKFYLNKLRVR